MPIENNNSTLISVRTVFFDFGSTLIYFDSEWASVQKRAVHELWRELSNYGIILESSLFKETFTKNLWDYYIEREITLKESGVFNLLERTLQDLSYPSVPVPILRTCLDAMYAVSQEHWQIEQDTIPTIEHLGSVGIRLGLISNAGDNKDVQMLLEKTKIRQYFECIVTSAEFGVRKPSRLIYDYALDCMKSKPTSAVMVGDNLIADIMGAQKIGMYAIWINRRTQPLELHTGDQQVIPDAVISSLAELPDLLARIQT